MNAQVDLTFPFQLHHQVTPLMVACELGLGDYSCTKVLLEFKCDVHLLDEVEIILLIFVRLFIFVEQRVCSHQGW